MERVELQRIISDHMTFTTMLYELIKTLLITSKIKYHTIENRTKNIDSLEEKMLRKKIKNVKEEIVDISGIRIILYYLEDVDMVVNLIKNNFTIDDKNSINKANLYNSNEFGYLSVHYIVTLDSKRSELPEWIQFSKLRAEIQIRTVLQHSWASISHELSYKKNYEIPKNLERKLYRLAGLFELADEQFSKIKEEHNTLKEQIINEGAIEDEINLLTLKYGLIKESSIINLIEEIAIESGFKCITEEERKQYASLKDEDENISNIAFLSDVLGYRYIYEIESNIQQNIEGIKSYFKMLIKKSIKDGSNAWNGTKGFFLVLSMLYLLNEKQINAFQEKYKWDYQISNRITETISELRNERK